MEISVYRIDIKSVIIALRLIDILVAWESISTVIYI